MAKTAIISPFYNESEGLALFLKSLDTAFADLDNSIAVYLIDDGSTDNSLEIIKDYIAINSRVEIHLIILEFNTGHQNAIYEGLKKASEKKYDNYIIMDSDGQDDPATLALLLGTNGYEILWVQRADRSEGFYFQVGYVAYQIIYRFITGKKIDFGNYSFISHRVARYLLANRFIHYPTALLKSPFKKSFVKAKRLPRLYGESKMSTQALVHHAFLSFVEDAEIVVNFFLKSTFIVLIFFLLSIGNILYQKYVAHTAILGWTSVTSIGLLNLVFLSFGLFAISLSILKIGKVNAMEYESKYQQLTHSAETKHE